MPKLDQIRVPLECILGRERNAGYIKYAIYLFFAWPKIMKIGQIENRLKLHQMVP